MKLNHERSYLVSDGFDVETLTTNQISDYIGNGKDMYFVRQDSRGLLYVDTSLLLTDDVIFNR